MYRRSGKKARWKNRADVASRSKCAVSAPFAVAKHMDATQVSDPQHVSLEGRQMRHIGRIFRLARRARPA